MGPEIQYLRPTDRITHACDGGNNNVNILVRHLCLAEGRQVKLNTPRYTSNSMYLTDPDGNVSGQHDAELGTVNPSYDSKGTEITGNDVDRNTWLTGYEGMSTPKRGKNTLVSLMQLSECQGPGNHTKLTMLAFCTTSH